MLEPEQVPIATVFSLTAPPVKVVLLFPMTCPVTNMEPSKSTLFLKSQNPINSPVLDEWKSIAAPVLGPYIMLVLSIAWDCIFSVVVAV